MLYKNKILATATRESRHGNTYAVILYVHRFLCFIWFTKKYYSDSPKPNSQKYQVLDTKIDAFKDRFLKKWKSLYK